MRKKSKRTRVRETKEKYENIKKTIDSYGITRYVNDQEFLHRNDGPAVLFPEGNCEWWLYGIPYTFPLWCIRANKTEEEIVILKLKYNIKNNNV